MPGTPFHEEGENRVYRLPPPADASPLLRGWQQNRLALARRGPGGARVDAVEHPANLPAVLRPDSMSTSPGCGRA
jgi:hypothetical protein